MMKWILGLVTLCIIIAAVLVVAIPAKAPVVEQPKPAQLDDLIIVDSPLPDTTLSCDSDVIITGKARGTWYFEASFPIQISNAGGTIIGEGHAEALTDWMTNDFVAFKSTIPVHSCIDGHVPYDAFVDLHNDNPSGDPAKGKSLSIPVLFK
jgi:hypothetical protein